MKKLLVVVDMQNDFIVGSLGSAAAEAIVPSVVQKISGWDGDIVYTLDTHSDNYLSTKEGIKLPIKHCIKNTYGWQLNSRVEDALVGSGKTKKCFEKETFGSVELGAYIKANDYEYIEFIGLCTDICVISNVIIAKAFVSEALITVDSKCCVGVTEDSHENALSAMQSCQVNII